MRLAARRDANDQVLAHTARKLGARMILAGPLDYWCGHRGRWAPVEIKVVKGRYTESQQRFLEQCQADGLPVWTWRTQDDVLVALGGSL